MIEIRPVGDACAEARIHGHCAFFGPLEDVIIFVIGFTSTMPVPIDSSALEPGNIKIQVGKPGDVKDRRVLTFPNAASLYLRAMTNLATPVGDTPLRWGDSEGRVWEPLFENSSTLTLLAWKIATRRLGGWASPPVEVPKGRCSNCLSRFVYHVPGGYLRRCITCMHTETLP